MTDAILKEALEAFKAADDAESENRENALDDVKFGKLGEQWPDAVKQQRDLEQRPCLTINRMNSVIRQVVNDSRQNRPAIKVHPADSKADPETAEVITGMIRNIEQSSDAEVAYDTGIEGAVAGGFGYWRVNLDYTMGAMSEEDILNAGVSAFEQDICIRRVANPFSVYGDPYSQQADSSDWNQTHIVEILTKAQFKKKYPGAKEVDFDANCWRESTAPWKDGDSIQVAEYWKREQVVKNALAVQLGATEDGLPGDVVVMLEEEFAKQRELIMAAGGVVVGQPRPIRCYKVMQHIVSGVEVLDSKPWKGSYIPIVPVYGEEVNVEGKRHFRSLIRDAKDAQRMLNYWRTSATELVALAPRAPFIGEEGAFDIDPRWSTANTATHAYLEHKKGTLAPQRQPFVGVPAGMLQEALNASDDIKSITGIYDASLGAKSNETSGRAIMARQREGDVSTFHFIDNLSRSIRHTGRIIVDLIPKVYSTERIARILGEDGTAKTVTINSERPQEANDEAKEALRIHDVRVGRYDVTVSSGPSYTSRREEARLEMMELLRGFPDGWQIIGDLLAKNLDWPGADEIAKRLEKMLPPNIKDDEGALPPEVQTQLQQMSEALQVMGQKLQEAEGKYSLEEKKLAIEEYKAETERMTALQPAFGPAEIQAIVLQTLRDLAVQELPASEGQATGLDLAA